MDDDGVVPLRDGRRLADRDYGARGGAPVIFLHGSTRTRSLAERAFNIGAGPRWSEAATSRLSKHLTRSPPTCPHTFAAGDTTDPRSAYSRARSRWQPRTPRRRFAGGRDRDSAPAVYRLGTLSREQDLLRGRANGHAAPISGHARPLLARKRSEVVLRAAPEKRKPRRSAVSESPLTDSNRRPLPYHGGPAMPRKPSGRLKPLHKARIGLPQHAAATGTFRHSPLPTGYPGEDGVPRAGAKLRAATVPTAHARSRATTSAQPPCP
jgi:hypothetical protein